MTRPEAPDPDHYDSLTLVFGTGVTIALSGGHPAARWDGLVTELAKKATAPSGENLANEIGRFFQVAGKPRSHHFTALLHIIRREIGPGWAKALQEVVGEITAAAAREKSRAKALAWGEALSLAGDLARRGLARLASTNFDDLVARASGLRVITRHGESYDPGDPAHPARLIDPPVPRPASGVPGLLSEEERFTLRVWGDTDFLGGRLREDVLRQTAGVLHLHGWHQRPDDLVVDPVDYHQAVERAAGRDLAARLLVEALANPRVLTLFCGVGDGMLDDHFIWLWCEAARTKGLDPRSNRWMLPRGESEKHERLEAEIRCRTNAGTRCYERIAYEEHEELPGLLMDHLEAFDRGKRPAATR